MTKKYVFSVQSLSQPLRLDAFLSQQREFSSRSQVQNLIKKHQVIVNGQCAKASLLVKNDDEISVDLSEEFSVIIKPEDIPQVLNEELPQQAITCAFRRHSK